MKTQNEAIKTQWHPAFCSAFKLELREDKSSLDFLDEHGINTKPIQIDLLVIKKTPDMQIKNEIGHLFRGYNLVEYKSPDDAQNVDVFAKVVGYAYLYKSYEAHVDEISFDDITLTFVRERYPYKLFRWFQENHFEVRKAAPGIYYVSRDWFFPVQVIVGNRLDQEGHHWLAALSGKLDEERLRHLLITANDLTEKEDRDNADSVLQVAIKENAELFDEVKKGDIGMWNEALRELMKPEIDQAIEEAVAKAVEQATAENQRRIEQATEQNRQERALIKWLLSQNRIAEAIQVIEDDEFRKVLLAEFYTLDHS